MIPIRPTVMRGDARALAMDDASVDLIVTSPPYWALRSYTDAGEHYGGQIGAEPTPAAYVDSLVECTREWMRVLKPSGSIWVNLGDKYAGSDGSPGGASKLQGGKKQRAVQGNGRKSTGAPTKSLIGLPWRYAIRCIDDLGLILRAEVIWSKPNGLPESVTDRVRRSHETWFHFTKSPRYFAAVDTIREAYEPDSARRKALYGDNPGRDGLAGLRATGAAQHGSNGVSAMGVGGSAVNPLGKLPGSVWTVATQPLKVPAELGIDHFAAFPMEFPRRIISGWSPPGICTVCGEVRRVLTTRPGGSWHDHLDDSTRGHNQNGAARNRAYRDRLASGVHRAITGEACACPDPSAPTRPAVVLDPFGGTGTTALVASALGRHGISVDMSADYCRLAEWRTNDPDQIAAALKVEKPPKVFAGQQSLFDAFGGGDA